MLNFYYLVQFHEIKIIFGAVGAFVVKQKHAHVLFLDLHGSVVEGVSGMLASGDGDDHIRGQHRSIGAFETLWRNTKYLAHRLLVTISFANIQVFVGIIKKTATFLKRWVETASTYRPNSHP